MLKRLPIFSSSIFSLCLAIGLNLTSQPGKTAELQEIEKRGYLVVAVKDNLRPLAFKGIDQQLQGFEIDVARRLAQEILGQPDAVVLQPVANQDRLNAVLTGQVDFAIARVTATASRSRVVSFSMPYYLDGAALVVRDATIERLSDLSRQKIAILNGSSTIATVRYFLPTAELVGVDSYQEGRSLLDAGQVAAFAADASVLSGWVSENAPYRLLSSLLSAEPLSVVMPKGVQHDDLRRKVNDAIARWYVEGWLKERARFWGLPWANVEEGKQIPLKPVAPSN